MNQNKEIIAIVVPCYNEAKRLDIKAFEDIISEYSQYLFCFIDDGSNDDTIKILNQLRFQDRNRVFVLHHKSNKGKAETIRTGVTFMLTQSKINFIGFMDADLSTPFMEIDYMANLLLQLDEVEIVCGSRIKRMGAKIVRKNVRHYSGRVVATFISLLLGMPFYDTQCGAKVMSLRVASLCFKEPFSTSWLFDVELFKRMQLYFKDQTESTIYEHPLKEWIHKDKSKVKVSYLFMLPIHLIMIRLRYR